MDDTLSIMEDMLLLIRSGLRVDLIERKYNVDDLINRIRDIRKQREQECLQEAEDAYEYLQQDEDGTQQREDYLCTRYPHAQGD